MERRRFPALATGAAALPGYESVASRGSETARSTESGGTDPATGTGTEDGRR